MDTLQMMTEVEPLLRAATKCDECFIRQGSALKRSLVDTAQPRPIGNGYAESGLRVVLVLLNPGAGKVRHQRPNMEFRKRLHEYRDAEDSAGRARALYSVFAHQWSGIPSWGGGDLARIYLEGFGLDLQKIALANVGWCATEGDVYPAETMLRPCFERHTGPLLRALRPHVVILAGGDAHGFEGAVRRICPGAEVACVPHYGALKYVKGPDRPKWIADAACRAKAAMDLARRKLASHQGT